MKFDAKLQYLSALFILGSLLADDEEGSRHVGQSMVDVLVLISNDGSVPTALAKKAMGIASRLQVKIDKDFEAPALPPAPDPE